MVIKSATTLLALAFAFSSCQQKPEKLRDKNQRGSFVGKWILSVSSEHDDDTFSIPLLKMFELNSDSTTRLMIVDSGKSKNVKGRWLWNPENNLINTDIQIDYKTENNQAIWPFKIELKDGKTTLTQGESLVYEKAEESLK